MNEVVNWYAVSAVLLFVKMFAISLYQGYHRIGKRTFKMPEDAALVGRRAVQEETFPERRSATNQPCAGRYLVMEFGTVTGRGLLSRRPVWVPDTAFAGRRQMTVRHTLAAFVFWTLASMAVAIGVDGTA